jgi:hypothetical protein
MKRTNAVANTIIMYAPLSIVAFVVIAMNPLLLISLIVVAYTIGLVKLARSKISVFRNGQWFSFGPSKMDDKNRARYYHGYATIGVTALLNLLSISLTRM